MRVEFNVIITYPNGHKDYNTYQAKKYADEMFEKLKTSGWSEKQNCKIEYFKTYWNGSSFHHKEILG